MIELKVYLWILLVFISARDTAQLQFSVAYNFMNTSGSSAIFQPWLAAKTGTIKFNFKTFDSDGLLFHVGDNNDPDMAGNYMYLKLEWGSAVLVTQVHYFSNAHEENKIEERISIGKNLDDGNWHGVNIERKGAYTVLKVDNDVASLPLADRISNLRITSNLYLGGIPRKYLEEGCESNKKRFQRFLGCIKDLGYGEGTYIGPPRMIDTEYVDQREVCLDACLPSNECQNGGICRNKFLDYECDCRATGYEGIYCERPSILLTLDGLGYLEHRSFSVSNRTEIVIGFKTRAREGIIFGLGDRFSFIVIEILQEKLAVSVKLKTGNKKTVILQSYKINDNAWHYIRVSRREQEVRAQVDKTFEEKLFLEAADENNGIIDNVHLGGAWNTAKIFPGFTQTKFCGCMAHVYFNDVDILQHGQYRGSARKTGQCVDSLCISK
ncbi:contactin-associated protein like 5-4-like [Rhopilema esculentum]|uniref:contactin-associated protein like 5-4-like n=1 Tax=Rhopilema esculentum TaxID=499914 RepID=UPI0031DE0310